MFHTINLLENDLGNMDTSKLLSSWSAKTSQSKSEFIYVVTNFGLKCTKKVDSKHLVTMIWMDFMVERNHDNTFYCDTTLKWQYDKWVLDTYINFKNITPYNTMTQAKTMHVTNQNMCSGNVNETHM